MSGKHSGPVRAVGTRVPVVAGPGERAVWGHFASAIAHELNTPLTSILAFADLLARNSPGNLTGGQLEQLEVMRRSGHRMGALINDLMTFSTLEVGEFRLLYTRFDFLEAVDEAAGALRPMLDSRRQTLSRAAPDVPVWIEADRERLVQVISNLLTNASKYSPEGSAVHLSVTVDDRRVGIRVADRGIGISPQDRQQLFASYFRAPDKRTRSVPGSGLGLAICRSIVELHGGEIALSSAPRAGTTVTVLIPRSRSNPAGGGESGEQPASAVYPAAERVPSTAG